MNRALVDPIANAVLYEGYILYPYRPSTKNRQRWTFGALLPDAYCRDLGGDSSVQQTECLVYGTDATVFEAVVRFLQLTDRRVGEVDPPLAEWKTAAQPSFRMVQELHVEDKIIHAWQEAEERELALGSMTLGNLVVGARRISFSLPSGRRVAPVRRTDEMVVGLLIREQYDIEVTAEVSATAIVDGLYRLTLRVANSTSLREVKALTRAEALLHSLASTHVILGVENGEFVSLIDPPEALGEAAASCRNIGAWPVLVGEEGQTDLMLSAPIILYDYPQVAPESPGNWFDGTEIDEMLALRIMTLTDDEKNAMAAVDDRAGELLARTEALAREQLLSLHGTVRALRTLPEGEHT
jgi:hypothetical protein